MKNRFSRPVDPRWRDLISRCSISFILVVVLCYQVLAALHTVRLLSNLTRTPRQPIAFSAAKLITDMTPEAERAGLKIGDLVEAINNLSFTAGEKMRAALGKAKPGDQFLVTFRRSPSKSGTAVIRLVAAATTTASLQTATYTLIAHIAIPLLCVGLAALVALSKPGEVIALLLFFLLVSFSALNPLAGWNAPWYPLCILVTDLAAGTFGVWIFLFGVYFPKLGGIGSKPAWIAWLVFPILAIALLNCFADLISNWSFRAAYPIARILPPTDVSLYFSIVGTLIFIVNLAWKVRKETDPDKRRRLRVLIAGTIAGFGPIICVVSIGLIQGRAPLEGVPTPFALVALLLMGLFPVTLAHVIVIRRAMDIQILVREGVRNALARRAVTLLRLTTLAVSYGFIALVAITHRGDISVLLKTLLVCALFTALLQESLLERLRRWVERRCFIELYRVEQVLSDLRSERFDNSEALAAKTLETVCQALQVERGCVMLFADGLYRLTASHQVSGIADIPSDAELINRIKSQPTPVPIWDLADEPSSRLMSVIERTTIDACRAEVIIPLNNSDQLLGFLLLGPRWGEQPFTGFEIGVLKPVATHASVQLENFQLLTSLADEMRERERKRAEAAVAEANSRAKSEFLARMSHELRTPLNAIIGYSEILMEEAQDLGLESFEKDLKRIHTSAKHLLELINSVLEISKIESGKMELFLEEFAISKVAAEVVDIVGPIAQQGKNKFVVDVADDLGHMRADRAKLRQTLINLIANASKFTDRGVVGLTVRRDNADTDGVCFVVSDTGIGMTAQQLAKLFQPFQQADASISGKYGGTGLGLSICKSFCEMMGGRISVESILGAGTTVTVSLPRVVSVPKIDQEAEMAAH